MIIAKYYRSLPYQNMPLVKKNSGEQNKFDESSQF